MFIPFSNELPIPFSYSLSKKPPLSNTPLLSRIVLSTPNPCYAVSMSAAHELFAIIIWEWLYILSGWYTVVMLLSLIYAESIDADLEQLYHILS